MPEKTLQASSFEAFWETTNKRGSKHLAKKAWAKMTAAERQIAAEKVRPFYVYFAKEYPGASLMLISTYLNGKHFLTDGLREVKPLSPDQDPAIDAIKSGKRHLCGRISAAKGRDLISRGLVTETDCRNVGIL